MSERGAESEGFLRHLQEEKLKTQAARTTYVTHKLAYATGLLALGSLKPGSVDLSPLLYLVPFFAIAFDLYILGEDYSVKRIGAFLRVNSTDALEKRWEDWVSRHRDHFAPLAMPILTNILAAAAALALWSQPSDSPTKIFIWLPFAWLPFAFLPIWGLFFYYASLRERVNKRAEESAANSND